MKKVQAITEGYYGNRRRKPGSVFEIDDSHVVGQWMEVLGESGKPAVVQAEAKVEDPRKPMAMSQVGKKVKQEASKKAEKLDSEDVI